MGKILLDDRLNQVWKEENKKICSRPIQEKYLDESNHDYIVRNYNYNFIKHNPCISYKIQWAKNGMICVSWV